MLKYLFKDVSILEAPSIVLTKCREVWDRIIKFKSKEPSVGHVDFNVFNSLAHAFNSIKILNKRDLDQSNWIYTWTPGIRRIFISYKIIYE